MTFIESLAKIRDSAEVECIIETFCSRVSVLATPLLKGFFYIVPHCVSSVSGVRLQIRFSAAHVPFQSKV